MAKLAENSVIVALDPQLPPLEANYKALKEIFNLARDCLAPVDQDRPNMTTCLSTLIKIKESYEQEAQCLPRAFSSVSTAERGKLHGRKRKREIATPPVCLCIVVLLVCYFC